MSEPGLFGNDSAPYAPFKTVGTGYEGVVVRTGKVQQRKFVPKSQRLAGKQGELETWPDGRPKYVSIVTIQTDLRDPEIPGDDGQRSLWISGKQMEDAAKKAVKESGASKDGIKPGGYFAMTFVHEVPNEDEDLSPTKFYVASYRPPVPGETQIVAGPASDDPWAQPQNPFPQVDAWGASVQPPGQPMPQPTRAQAYVQQATPTDTRYDQGGRLPQPSAGPQQPQGTPPDTQAMINKLLQQQQGGTQ